MAPSSLLRNRSVSGFDVICAGEARWDLGALDAPAAGPASPGFRPGGAAVTAALALARRGLRVALVAALGDDSFGRNLRAKVAAAGVDIGGVSLSSGQQGLFFVEGRGAAGQIVSYRREEPPISIPPGWAAQVLLLTGLSPVLSQNAAFCREARHARRAGSIVVVDVNARHHLWMGRDPRAIRAVIGEADVVRCSTGDLSVLGLDAAALRGWLRPRAVLVTGAAGVQVSGSFGEIVREPRRAVTLRAAGSGDALTAALCAELVKAGPPGTQSAELWESALQRAQGAPRGNLLR